MLHIVMQHKIMMSTIFAFVVKLTSNVKSTKIADKSL
jgi:hypothetical protein